MASTDNASRYWFSLWGNIRFANGWVFGDTPQDALANAIRDVLYWYPATTGTGKITLQRDTTPAEYFDFDVTIP